MRTLRFLAAGAVALSLLWACSDDEDELTPEPVPELEPSEEYDEAYYAEHATISSEDAHFTATEEGGEIEYKVEGGEVVVNVDCEIEWTAEVAYSDAEGWLDAAVNCEAGTLTVTAEANTVEAEKTATVTVMTAESGIEFATISVSQNAYGACEITVETNEWNAPAVGELTTEIAVEATADWEITNTADWLTAEKTDTGVKLTASENEETEERTAEVVLTCTDGISTDSETITVTQDAKAYITIAEESEELNFAAEGGTETVEVDSNYDWSSSASENWITVSGNGNTLTVTVSGNESEESREGTITITAGDGAENVAEATITVSQAGVSATANSLILVYNITSANTTIQLPINGDIDCIVNWGDGSERSEVTAYYPEHVYAEAGEYEITISGTVSAICAYVSRKKPTNSAMLTAVKQWGETGLTSMSDAFYQCTALASLPEETGDAFAEVETFYRAFYQTVITTVPKDFFTGCTKVTDMSYVFNACKSLTTIPEGLFDDCTAVTTFEFAFENCSVLEAIPKGLFDNCTEVESFEGTFHSCVDVTTIPDGLFDNCTKVKTFEDTFEYTTSIAAIPKGLFDNCPLVTTFSGTFYNTAITEIPEGLFDYCPLVNDFYGIFYNCKSLSSIPKGLFDKNTKVESFNNAFRECPIKEIPAGLFDYCTEGSELTFRSIFYNCTSLESIPAGLFDNVKEIVTDATEVFYSCKSLKTVPAGLFAGLTANEKFSNTFMYCENLETIPSDLFKGCSAVTTFGSVFRGCYKLKTIPAGLFEGCSSAETFTYVFDDCTVVDWDENGYEKGLFSETAATTFSNAFNGCAALTSIPDNLFKNCTKVTTYTYVFANCTSLKSIPAGLFDDSTKTTTFSYSFRYDAALTGESPYTIINVEGENVKVHLYERADYTDYFSKPSTTTSCFQDCTGLDDYYSIPSSWGGGAS